jgi:DNA (cytosine-5)-methyltransferase 1
MLSYYEFFAGGGMARAGLGPEWHCLFANDFDHKKGRIYRENWGGEELKTADVGTLTSADLRGDADLAWASFPCQDLSLAGGGAGLRGDRSGTFWPFWNLMKGLITEGRAPRLLVLENVCGTLTSHDGKDFATIIGGFYDAGYAVGAVVIDAALFVPHSRPRLFIIGVRGDVEIPAAVRAEGPSAPWRTRTLEAAYDKLPPKVRRGWVWWSIPTPPERKSTFSDLIEEDPRGVPWFSAEETRRLLSMMSPVNRAKVAEAKRQNRRMVGGVYKRTRPNETGLKVQRAEVRFDDVSGCLRTPAGGSSRQVIVIVDGQSVKARLISTRETARLMGLPEEYVLPENYNEGYHITGDGVVVPVVRHLAQHIFEPILDAHRRRSTAAA